VTLHLRQLLCAATADFIAGRFRMSCEGSGMAAAEDEPMYLVVRKTFFEVGGMGTRSRRTRSEPNCFKPLGLEDGCPEEDSQGSTEASSEDEPPAPGSPADKTHPLKGKLLLPAAILRDSPKGGQDRPFEKSDGLLSSRACEDDDTHTRRGDRKLTYVPTPSTFGRRTPEGTQPVKKVSFAADESSDDELRDGPIRKTGCLRKSSCAGNSPFTPARRVSFAAFDEVVHIPADGDPSAEEARIGGTQVLPLAPAAAPFVPMSALTDGVSASSRVGTVAKETSISLSEASEPWVPPVAAPTWSSILEPKDLANTYLLPRPEAKAASVSLSASAAPWMPSPAAPPFVPMKIPLHEANPLLLHVSPHVEGPCIPPVSKAKLVLPPPAVPSVSMEARGSSGSGFQPSSRDAWARFGEVVEGVRSSLATSNKIVVCVEAKEGSRGWTITAYVQPQALKPCRDQLLAAAQQALQAAADRSDSVFLLGYAGAPFTLMPLGFGAAIADMPDKGAACWASFAKGFCDSPGTCCKEHPKCQVGVNVMLKPARSPRR